MYTQQLWETCTGRAGLPGRGCLGWGLPGWGIRRATARLGPKQWPPGAPLHFSPLRML